MERTEPRPAADGSGPPARDAVRRGAATAPEEGLQCMEVWGGNGLADSFLRTKGLDLWAFSRPHGGSDSGGDVLYVSSCSSGRISRILLADVMGHGEAAAETALSLRSLMRSVINILSPDKLIRALNREFQRLDEKGAFASALVLSYFRPTGALSLCNAGHPPPLVYRAREGRWKLLGLSSSPSGAATEQGVPVNLPLGILSRVRYDLYGVELGPDDLLLLYTDGVTELEDAEERMLGPEGLLEIVESVTAARSSTPEGFIGDLLSAVADWRGGPELDDDTSLLLMRRNTETAGLVSDLLAPLRFLRHRIAAWLPA